MFIFCNLVEHIYPFVYGFAQLLLRIISLDSNIIKDLQFLKTKKAHFREPFLYFLTSLFFLYIGIK